ncbi:MAG: cytosine permease [Sphingobium sp.]|jgi:cytosine permease|nr:cytosine permease [Sphingobium sp.]MCP5400277.1 cytosine permease [Sphingomonas sp.]
MANNDFAFEAVPPEKTVSGFRIAIVIIGIIIALPAFITGSDLGFRLGFRNGVLAITLGGLILTIIAMATGTIGAKTRLNTAMIIKRTFGTLGGRFVSGVLAVACLGWFGVTAEVFGRSLHQMLVGQAWDALPPSAYILLGGLLMVATTIFGFAALQRLSNITVPMLAVLIAYTAFLTLKSGSLGALGQAAAGQASLGDGISAIVGGYAVAVTIFPDLCRFSKSSRGAQMAALLTYTIAMPCILMLAMIPSIVTGEHDLTVIMTTLGLGLPALALLVFKAWATNSGNLYFASLSAANFLGYRGLKTIIIGAGVLGVLIAVSGLTDRLIGFLVALGVSIPPIAGIYIADFLHHGADKYMREAHVQSIRYGAFACWAFGIAVAILARMDVVSLSGISAIDSMVAAAASYLLLRRLRPAADSQVLSTEVS